MLEGNYDEDISKNKLFGKIQNDHSILLETAALEKWIICLPRQESIERIDLNSSEKDFILGHFLIPNEELPGTHFVNLIGDSFELNDNKYLKRTSSSDGMWNILFKELFYTKDYCKIDIWCISSSLMSEKASIWKNETVFETVDDAKKFLKSSCGLTDYKHFQILRKFLYCISEDETLCFKDLQNEVEKYTNEIYTQISNTYWTEMCNDPNVKGQIKTSILWLVMHETYAKTFKTVSSIAQKKEEEFNKALVNISNLSGDGLKVAPEYWASIPMVKKEISLIHAHRTPIEKFTCLRNAFELIKPDNQSQPTLDDLLSVIVHVIVKSGYPYWVTTFSYMQTFLNLFEKNQKGFNEFILSTIEAAISFIIDFKESAIPSREIKVVKNVYKTKDEFLEFFFYLIESNDEKGILNILNIPLEADQDIYNIILEKKNHFAKVPIENGTFSLCHPLCDCIDCQTKVDQNVPSITTSNKSGQTGLHIASKYGYPKMVSILLSLGLQPNIKDSAGHQALHYAAANGHQNVLLLLLHAKADIEATIPNGQTAMQLSAQFGHSGCVKAMLFFADHMKIKFDINHRDVNGNTALHMASKWGFFEIVESLLEYGADMKIKNKNGANSCTLAHNNIIKKMLLKIE